MLVKAKCAAPAWDYPVHYRPGQEYEIEHDGKLASLKLGGRWVFEFDRTMAGTGTVPTIGGFVCKKCQKPFDTVDKLALHARQDHKQVQDAETIEALKEQPEPVKVDRRGKSFTCKICHEPFPNLNALTRHKKGHNKVEPAAETVAAPA